MGIFKKEEEKVTDEELKNEEAAEKLAEEKVEEAIDLAADDVNEDKEPGKFMARGAAEVLGDTEKELPEGFRVATAEEIKAIKDFEELFGHNAHPLTVMVGLANRIKELEKKVF
jgi:hypothetical protein